MQRYESCISIKKTAFAVKLKWLLKIFKMLFRLISSTLFKQRMKTTQLLILMLFSLSISAQYTVSTFTEDYTSLSDEQNLGIESDWDDPFFTLPLGFDFQIGTSTISSISQDGVGATFFSGTFDNGNALGYFEDLIDGSSLGDASFITYKVDGNVGERICKIQYANCAFYDEVEIEGSANNRVNFQIWFYESDFAVEFRFGPSSISNPELAYLNFQGPIIGIFQDITDDGETVGTATYLSGNPESPTVETNTDVSQIEFNGLSGTPEDGRVYRFTPSSLNTDDLKKELFSIYPTLATEEIWIKGTENLRGTYSITNLAGQVVETGVLNSDRIDVSFLQPGFYLISIGDTSQKFLKQ